MYLGGDKKVSTGDQPVGHGALDGEPYLLVVAVPFIKVHAGAVGRWGEWR